MTGSHRWVGAATGQDASRGPEARDVAPGKQWAAAGIERLRGAGHAGEGASWLALHADRPNGLSYTKLQLNGPTA